MRRSRERDIKWNQGEIEGGTKIETKSFSHTLLVFSSLVVLWTNLIVGVQTAARGVVCVFCRSRLEIQEKVLRVIQQKTQSRRRDRECYKAIPPRSSCRQDQFLYVILDNVV